MALRSAPGLSAVSIAFGHLCRHGGMAPLTAALMSLTKFDLAGQFCRTILIFQKLPRLEIGLTFCWSISRYMLMSIIVNAKDPASNRMLKRLLISYGVTDEI